MEKILSRRQGSLLIICSIIATKIQRLPSVIAHDLKADGWIASLLLYLLDALAIFLVCFIMENLNGLTLYEVIEKAVGKFISKLFCIVFIVFFFMKSVVAFKGTHEFFSTTLFDMLSWQVFSILLLLLMLLMVSKGLRVIGRNAELYIYLILFGFISSIILGATATDYSKILPVFDIKLSKFIEVIPTYSLHFGDYLIVLFFVGNIKDQSKKVKWVYSAINLAVGIIASFAYIVFYGIYENVAEYQPHALADITQFSLIGLGLGRLDWFLILFVLIATFISTALYLWIVVYSIQRLFNLKQKVYVTVFAILSLYIVEFYIFKNTESVFNFLKNGFMYFTLGVEFLIPIFLVAFKIIIGIKKRRIKNA